MYSDEAKTKPCLRNIPFDSEGDVSQLPETGVLSILQFTLHPGVDLLQPSQPVSSLWRDSLEFISTIPGFQGLYWAPVSQDTVYQQIIIILVQWEDGLAWRRFQCSIGLSMLLGYLAESFNRCIELSLPTGLSSSKSLLELVSYRYPPRLSSTGLRSSEVEEEKQRFKEAWELSVLPLASITPAQSGRIFAFGDWLQRDSPLEDQIFIGLLFWGDTQPHRQQDQTAFDVVTRLNELSKDATSVVSCITMPLCYIPSGYFGAKKLTKPSTDSPQWKHPLLKVKVTPIYEPTESTGPGYADQVHLKSVTEAKAVSTTRISAGPAGRWYCMGLLNQHNMPKRPEFTPKATLELITFRVRSGTSIAGAFKDLRLRLWNLAQDSEVRWGIDHENVGWYTRYSLLINPRGMQLSNEIQAEFQHLIHEFARQCGDKIFDMSQRKIRGPSELRLVKDLEISTFYIPANDYDKVSFEYAYTLYIGSSFAQLRDGTSLTETPAARPTAHGWAIENNLQSDPKMVPFTSVFSWKSQAARQEWYGDYARRARAEFNRLGHIIDWLQTLCKRVDIQFLLLEEEDSEISEAILKSMMQNMSQPHKPVFTLW